MREKYIDNNLKIKMRYAKTTNFYYKEFGCFIYYTISLTNDKSKKISGILDCHNVINIYCNYKQTLYKQYIENKIEDSLSSFLFDSAKRKDYNFVIYLKTNFDEKIKDVISCFFINKVSKVIFGF